MNKQTWLIVACIILGVALLPLPYGHYQFLRIFICGMSVWLLFDNYNKNINMPIGLFITTIMYNPIFKIHFDRPVWSVVNIITLIYFIYLIQEYKTKE